MQALERPAEGAADGGLVFFHGYHGIPGDFLGFVDKLDPERRLHAFLPRAMHPVGDEGRWSWFASDGPRSLDELRPVLDWLDALPFPPGQLVLGGWSQGAVVAYAAGLGEGRPAPAGVVALGGALPRGMEIAGSAPVAIGHGRADESVPVAEARQARDTLRARGVPTLYLETDIDHRIDQAIVPALRAFVAGLP